MNYSNQVLQVKLEEIVPNRFQPRENFENDGIEELAKSIKEHGIIQPLVLRRLGDKYEIIAGERRYKAATLAGLTTVPAILSDISDEKSAEVALVENIQRRNLSAIEEARSYKAIIDSQNITQEELATKMGLSQSSIANKLRLLNLCDEVQDALMTQKISERHARSLLNIEDKVEQKKWLDRILNERLTVRQLDMEIKNANQAEPVKESVNLNKIPNIEEIRNNAQDIIPPQEIKNLDNILTPDKNLTKIDEENKNMNEEQNPVESPANTNRFFNFLEDIGPNMTMEDPINLINNNVNPENLGTDDGTTSGAPTTLDIPTENANLGVNPTSAPTESIEEFNPFAAVPPVAPTEPSIENPFMEPMPSLDSTPMVDNVAPIEPMPSVNTPMESPVTPVAPEVMPTVNPTPVVPEVNELNPFVEAAPVNQGIPETPVAPSIEPVPEVTNLNPFMEAPEQSVAPVNNMPTLDSVMPTEPVTPVAPTNPFEEQTPVAPTVAPMDNPFLDNPVPTMENVPQVEEPSIPVTPGQNNVIDPMNNVDLLDPNREEKIEQVQTTLVSLAITSLRNSVTQLERQGFVIDVEELDLDDKYQITISIQK